MSRHRSTAAAARRPPPNPADAHAPRPSAAPPLVGEPENTRLVAAGLVVAIRDRAGTLHRVTAFVGGVGPQYAPNKPPAWVRAAAWCRTCRRDDCLACADALDRARAAHGIGVA